MRGKEPLKILMVSTEHFNTNALNEIALLKQDTASMLSIHAYINNDYLTSYQADGLIISTHWFNRLLIKYWWVNPFTNLLVYYRNCPHNLTSRSLVVDD